MPENGHFFEKPVNTKSSWVVEPLVRRNRQVMSAGYPGEGKSIIDQIMLYSIAYEALFADIFAVTPGNVMFIDSENHWETLKMRTDKIKKGLEMDGYTKKHRVWWEPYCGLLLEDSKTWEPILKIVDDVKPIIISLDHLRKFHNLNEDKSTQMNRVNDGLMALKDRQASTVYINHHFNKTDIRGSFQLRLRGSTALLANTDIAFEVRALSRKRIGEELYLDKVGVIFQPRKEPTPLPIVLSIEEGKDYMKLHYEMDYKPIDDPEMDRIYHDIFHVFLKADTAKTVNDIKTPSGGYASDREIRSALRGLEARGILKKTITTNGKFLYESIVKRCPWCNATCL